MTAVGPAIASTVRSVLAPGWPRRAARTVVGLAVLIAIITQVGAEPFLRGLRAIDAASIAAALLLAAVATGAAAWRWRIIATRLGVAMTWPAAVDAYYQSQFLNAVLPGGVLGDARRALVHGRANESIPRAARAVVIERTAGQAVQFALTVSVLAWLAPDVAGPVLTSVAAGAAILGGALLAAVASSARVRRFVRRELGELALGMGSGAILAQVAIASAVVVACHVATFAVAAHAVGATVPPGLLASIALVVLLAAAVPLNVGGWGPREGVAAWAFAFAGFDAASGVAASTAFGVLALVALAPGFVLTVAASVRRRRASATETDRAPAGAERKVRS